jgi:hypothetical protein
MLSNDARYSGAEDRNRYLNSLLRKKFKLDDEPEAPKPTCYGDVRRMQMQIGATPRPVITRYSQDANTRHAQNDALRNAIAHALPSLPDLVTVGEVIAILPPDVTEPIMASRLPMAVAVALALLGVHVCKKTTLKGGLRLYAVRHRRRFRGMGLKTLLQVKATMVAPRARTRAQSRSTGHKTARRRTPAARPPKGRQRPSGQRLRRLTA